MTVRRKKKAPAGSKTAAALEADVLFGRIVRAPGCCVECGTTEFIQCAHGFSRRYRATRWDLRNAWPLCRRCHKKYTENPLLWDEWLNRKWGGLLYLVMRDAALYGPTPDPRDIVAELRPIWNELEAA